jgi:hypothetical protein
MPFKRPLARGPVRSISLWLIPATNPQARLAFRSFREYDSIVMITIQHTDHADLHIVTSGDVHVIEKIDQHSFGSITCHNLTIGQKIDQHSADADDPTAAPLVIRASGTVRIGQKIDQHCKVTIFAQNLLIGQGISQHCIVRHRVTGNLQLGTIDGNCDVKAF